MKRMICVCMFFLVCSSLFAGTEPADIILLVDTSVSMESCFNDVAVFLMDDLLRTKVHQGDTLHLLRFSDVLFHEKTQTITDNYSVSSIIKEILFLRQKVIFGKYTDVMNALKALFHYLGGLSPSREKIVYLITDMEHDPPPASPYAHRDPELIKYALSRSTNIIRSQDNWYVLTAHLPENTIIFPETFSSQYMSSYEHYYSGFSSELVAHSEKMSDTSGKIPDTSGKMPDTSGKISEKFGKIPPFLALIDGLGIGDDYFQPEDSQFYPAFRELKSPVTDPDRDLLFNTNDDQVLFFSANPGSRDPFFILILCFLVCITILVLLSILIIKRKKKLEGSFGNVFDTEQWHEHIAAFPGNDIPMIEMKVSFQNPHIGFRNIHKVKDNKTMSIGGGMSRFLIFLIPIPQHIADISKENGSYVFYPVQKEFFPDLKGPVVDCLKKEIPVVSKHGYRSLIEFREYVSPLTQLHTLLHSVQCREENTKEVLHTHKLALSAIIM